MLIKKLVDGLAAPITLALMCGLTGACSFAPDTGRSIRRINADTAEVSEFRNAAQLPNWIFVDGTTLSVEQAAAISGHRGHIFLTGRMTVSREAQDALSKHTGNVWPAGITSLESLDLAKKLGSNVFDPAIPIQLELSEITELPPDLAREIVAYPGEISIPQLPSVTPELADAFSRHKCKFGIGLFLRGIKRDSVPPDLQTLMNTSSRVLFGN
jgi:hypothetical protein